MAIMRKCHTCNKEYSKNTMQTCTGKLYCSDCIDEAKKKTDYLQSLRKCSGECGKKYPLPTLKQVGSKKMCPECAEKILKERESREKLYDLICSTMETPYPSGAMLQKIKEYKCRGYTYEGMILTINYAHKNKKIKNYDSLGFIPYYYKIALEDKRLQLERYERVKAFNREKHDVDVIVIDMSKREKIKPRLNNSRLIELD